MKYQYDGVIIGSWPGWLTVAAALWILGQKVCMVEKGHIWGDCTNSGCVPSKALLHYAKTHESETVSVEEAMRYVREHRQAIRDEETPEILAWYNVETRFGFASFVDDHTIQITKDDGSTEMITSKRFVIATGSKARTIALEGVDPWDILTNEELFELDKELRHLVIIGDGAIACEMAEAFAGVGVEVTMLSKHNEILDKYDREVSVWMHGYLNKQWVNILVNATPVRVNEDGKLLVDAGGKKHVLSYDKILLAIGKEPVTDWLQLESVWVEVNQGVVVDSYCRTSRRHIWAIGDCVAGNPQQTHRSNHQARYVVQNIVAGWWNLFSPSIKHHPLPTVLFTDYEVATVGMGEDAAVARYGRENCVIRLHPFAKNDRSKLTDSTEWFLKVIAKRGRLNIVWVTIIGRYAGEILPFFTYAVKHKVSLLKLSSLIVAYPTRAEIVKWLIDEYFHELSKDWKKEVIWAIKRVLYFWKR